MEIIFQIKIKDISICKVIQAIGGLSVMCDLVLGVLGYSVLLNLFLGHSVQQPTLQGSIFANVQLHAETLKDYY